MYGDEVCTSLERNVVLIGFMGSGKSVVGRELTRLMRRRLVDTDQEVVRRHRMGISAIFAKHGEERFRLRVGNVPQPHHRDGRRTAGERECA
jgi:shikimate kinase